MEPFGLPRNYERYDVTNLLCMDIFAARAIVNWHSHSVAKSGYCAIVRDWGKVKDCCQFSCLKKKTVAHAVDSLIDVNSAHCIFHTSASESVITFGKKNNEWGEDYSRERGTEFEHVVWCYWSGPSFVNPIWSDPVRSDRGFDNGLLHVKSCGMAFKPIVSYKETFSERFRKLWPPAY